jgi:glycosyltransferase involved in cell wall biosynthesis
LKLAIVGIQGVPNNYGGFETLVENLIKHLPDDFEIVVYCSSTDMKSKCRNFKNARLKYIPITSHGALGILYDSVSLLDAIRSCDKVLILGFGGGFVMPFLKGYQSKIVSNMGGLDWKRNKWSMPARKVIRFAEKLIMKYSGSVVSDNLGIRNYILEEYGKETVRIAYGGDQASDQLITKELSDKYAFLNKDYAFAVARIQPDNNIEMMMNAFSENSPMPIVIVGNWQNSNYGQRIKLKYQDKKNLILLEAIYERNLLDVLRSNCTIYIHGHSAGGTNPSLVDAMYLGLPVFCYASGYNEYTTENVALYFRDAIELARFIDNYKSFDLSGIGRKLKVIADKSYRWKNVVEQYKEIFLENK